MPRAPAPRRSATRTERRRAAVQRRRRLASARALAAHRTARRRRRLKFAAAVVAVAVVVAGGVELQRYLGSRPPSQDLHAQRVDGVTEPLAMSTPLARYHAIYRADAYKGAKVTPATEDVSVRRPFDGRVTIREGTKPGGALQFEGRSTLGVYANYSESGPGQVSGDAPTVAFGDVRLAASLDDLLAKGLFVRRERRRTLGRDCQVYRTGSPVQALKITAPTAADHVDACLDEAGLVLEQVTVVKGKLTQRLTATQLVPDANFEPGIFDVTGNPLPVDQGGSVLTAVDPAAPTPAGFWQPAAPPPGFDHQGRYSLQTGDQTSQSTGNPPVTSYIDVYVRGDDILVVRQGPAAGEPDLSTAASDGDPIDAGALGQAQLKLSATGPVLAAHPNGGFVHVSTTLSAKDLAAVAGAMRAA